MYYQTHSRRSISFLSWVLQSLFHLLSHSWKGLHETFNKFFLLWFFSVIILITVFLKHGILKDICEYWRVEVSLVGIIHNQQSKQKDNKEYSRNFKNYVGKITFFFFTKWSLLFFYVKLLKNSLNNLFPETKWGCSFWFCCYEV